MLIYCSVNIHVLPNIGNCFGVQESGLAASFTVPRRRSRLRFPGTHTLSHFACFGTADPVHGLVDGHFHRAVNVAGGDVGASEQCHQQAGRVHGVAAFFVEGVLHTLDAATAQFAVVGFEDVALPGLSRQSHLNFLKINKLEHVGVSPARARCGCGRGERSFALRSIMGERRFCRTFQGRKIFRPYMCAPLPTC